MTLVVSSAIYWGGISDVMRILSANVSAYCSTLLNNFVSLALSFF